MRRFDKKENIKNANLLAEQRHLTSKGLLKEAYLFPLPLGANESMTLDLLKKYGISDGFLYKMIRHIIDIKDLSIKKLIFEKVGLNFEAVNKVISKFYNVDAGWANEYDPSNKVEPKEVDKVLELFSKIILTLFKKKKLIFNNFFILKYLMDEFNGYVFSNDLMDIVDDKKILANLSFGIEYEESERPGTSTFPHELIRFLDKKNLDVVINDVKQQGEENMYYETLNNLL